MTLLDAHPLVQVRGLWAGQAAAQGIPPKPSQPAPPALASIPALPDLRHHSSSQHMPLPRAVLQVRRLSNPRAVYSLLMDLLARLAGLGLVHCDYNEFNLLVRWVSFFKIFLAAWWWLTRLQRVQALLLLAMVISVVKLVGLWRWRIVHSYSEDGGGASPVPAHAARCRPSPPLPMHPHPPPPTARSTTPRKSR